MHEHVLATSVRRGEIIRRAADDDRAPFRVDTYARSDVALMRTEPCGPRKRVGVERNGEHVVETQVGAGDRTAIRGGGSGPTGQGERSRLSRSRRPRLSSALLST